MRRLNIPLATTMLVLGATDRPYGEDRLWGLAGGDILYGGNGEDVISGGTDGASLSGGLDEDAVFAEVDWTRSRPTARRSRTDERFVRPREHARCPVSSPNWLTKFPLFDRGLALCGGPQ